MTWGISLPSDNLNVPALKPPPGEVSDFENAWNNNRVAQTTNALCLFAVIVATLIRVYAKVFCLKKIQVEDGERPIQVLKVGKSSNL